MVCRLENERGGLVGQNCFLPFLLCTFLSCGRTRLPDAVVSACVLHSASRSDGRADTGLESVGTSAAQTFEQHARALGMLAVVVGVEHPDDGL